MNAERCLREDEVLDALTRRFLGAELEEHAAHCDSCTELLVVARAFLEEKTESMLTAPVPSAGTMWWRMQMRQRHDAQIVARRTLLMGQAITLTVAATVIVLALGADVAAVLREAVTSILISTPLVFALAASLLLAPIAGYVAIRQK